MVINCVVISRIAMHYGLDKTQHCIEIGIVGFYTIKTFTDYLGVEISILRFGDTNCVLNVGILSVLCDHF